MVTSRLQLEAINCSFCADVIERAVKSLPGVRACKVNVCMKQVVVEYDAQNINLAVIQHALTRAGYTAQPIDAQTKPLDEASAPTTSL